MLGDFVRRWQKRPHITSRTHPHERYSFGRAPADMSFGTKIHGALHLYCIGSNVGWKWIYLETSQRMTVRSNAGPQDGSLEFPYTPRNARPVTDRLNDLSGRCSNAHCR
ncbi:hypothetical protein XU18_4172 [Perkinsela sp. CCAP 1560/4]|nr:hypothetical protein XU18_4172 [Perkinsela sp. CCAP 1560/4]|eukprot:KNH04632.1 hypothetical protein XU18_4172 [Perkinsela sp. CCAP 1560/4]